MMPSILLFGDSRIPKSKGLWEVKRGLEHGSTLQELFDAFIITKSQKYIDREMYFINVTIAALNILYKHLLKKT